MKREIQKKILKLFKKFQSFFKKNHTIYIAFLGKKCMEYQIS